MNKVSIRKTFCNLKFISLFSSFTLEKDCLSVHCLATVDSQSEKGGEKRKRKGKESWFQIKGMKVFSNKCKNPTYFIQFLIKKRPQMGYFQKCFLNLRLHFGRISWFGWTNMFFAYMQIRKSMNRNFYCNKNSMWHTEHPDGNFSSCMACTLL